MSNMDMDINNILWNETEFKLKFVLDNPNFSLPQIVRVVQGHMVDEDDSIASGQVLTLHGKRKLESFIGTDGYGKDVNIPANCPYRVQIVSLGNERQFSSVNELCFCENPPNFIKIIKDLSTGNGTTVEAYTKMQIVDHMLTENGDVIGINCKLDKSEKIESKVTLPINLNAIFIESISTELESKSFTLSEIRKEYELPIEVKFLPVTERNCGYGPQLGDITLEKKLSVNSILATSVIDGVRHAMTFSADLPITIQVMKGLVDNRRQMTSSCSSIDLNRFDYISSSNDPYSTYAIQDMVYEELKTPLLPRREPKLQRTNSSTFSDYNGYSFPPPIQQRRSVTTSDVTATQEKYENEAKKRGKSLDLGKDIERYVKSRFSFRGLKKFKKSSKNKNSVEKDKDNSDIEFDTQSTRTFMTTTSDDGSSSNGISTIDVRSNGSDSTYNTSFSRIAECMDALTMEAQNIPPIPRRRTHSRKNSSDSGICLSGRKQNRSRSRDRSRSRLTPDTPSSNPSDNNTFDNLSEWSLPVHIKDSPMSERKSTTSSQKTSASYLWGTEENDDDTNNNNKINLQKNEEFNNTNQNFLAINYTNDGDKTVQNNTQEIQAPSPLNSAQEQSIEEIRTLNEEGVGKILELLKLDEYKDLFQENQINGELLLDLEQGELVNELKLSLFQAKKIIKYAKGWRPESQNSKPSETSRRNSLNPRDWSENDVFVHMTTINLLDLGRFCKMNQVNGDLLLDILDKDTLLSLKQDHNVNMSNLESKKLLNFVVKGWRPDSSPKKAAAM